MPPEVSSSLLSLSSNPCCSSKVVLFLGAFGRPVFVLIFASFDVPSGPTSLKPDSKPSTAFLILSSDTFGAKAEAILEHCFFPNVITASCDKGLSGASFGMDATFKGLLAEFQANGRDAAGTMTKVRAFPGTGFCTSVSLDATRVVVVLLFCLEKDKDDVFRQVLTMVAFLRAGGILGLYSV
jgi:hypothetical protein